MGAALSQVPFLSEVDMKLAINLMALLAVLSLTGCAVNVVVAPHATFAVESRLDSPVDASLHADESNNVLESNQ